jgi:hypothetical protein
VRADVAERLEHASRAHGRGAVQTICDNALDAYLRVLGF